jgi:uncharacterized membrane protein YdjX (TVP38/TMEM64 family)
MEVYTKDTLYSKVNDLKDDKKSTTENIKDIFTVGPYHWAQSHQGIVKSMFMFSIVIMILLSFRTTYVRSIIINSLKYVQSKGNTGKVLFIIGSIIISLITGNCTIANIASGLIYGFKEGFIFSMVIVYIIAIVAYYIGRKFMRNKILKELDDNDNLKVFKIIKDNEKSLTPLEKTEFVLLSRLPPIFPFQYVSYFWGIINTKMKYFLIGTLGVIPSVMLESYLGSIIENVEELFTSNKLRSSHKIKAMIGILIFSGIISLIIGYMANERIKNKTDELKTKQINV